MRLRNRIQETFRSLILEKIGVKYDYGCVMMKVDLPSDKFQAIQDLIEDDDIFEGDEYGRENDPHITLLYGIHETEPEEKVEELVGKISPVTITLDEIGVFKNHTYDVVHFNVTNEVLTKYNSMLRDGLKHTTTFPDYKAHMTIAYVKPGKGDMIKNLLNKTINGDEFVCDKVIYSKVDGSKRTFDLNAQKEE